MPIKNGKYTDDYAYPLWMSRGESERLKAYAASHGMSIAAVIRLAVARLVSE